MSRIEGWSVRTVSDRIDSMLYEYMKYCLTGHEFS